MSGAPAGDAPGRDTLQLDPRIRCPRCRELLDEREAGVVVCRGCSARYPIVCGIPDLRVHGDPYLSVDEDVAAATRLAERAERHGFAEVLASYYAENPKVSPTQARLFTRGVLAAGDRAATVLSCWRTMDADQVPRTMLDIGAGTAPLAIAAARAGIAAVAVDAGLRWLVLARLRAREAGVDIPLVCANVEALPFADAAFDAVAGESIVENVRDQAATLREGRRVMRPGGALFLSVPNRHSVGPDPHTGIIAGGWLPEGVTAAIVARRGDVMPRRRLLTAGELRAMLTASGYEVRAIALPDIAAAQRASASGLVRAAVDGYQLAKRLPLVGTLLMSVAPTLLVVARRDDEARASA